MSEEQKDEMESILAEIRELRIASGVFISPIIAWLIMMASPFLFRIEIFASPLAFFGLYFLGGWIAVFCSYISLDLDRDIAVLRRKKKRLEDEGRIDEAKPYLW